MEPRKLYAVCDYIILFMEEEGLFLNVVKLQRLLYIAHAWHLAFHSHTPLLNEGFEAWKFGPVNRTIHNRFRGRSSFYSPITIADRWFSDPADPLAILSVSEREHLDNILNIYGDMTTLELEEMLQHEDPWRLARVGLSPEETSSRDIPDEVIYAYYKRVSQM